MNRLAIIVLNWNGIEDTLKSIDSLLLQTYPQLQIVVIENGSSDNSKVILEKYQKKHSDKVEVIYNTENLGFAGGVNTGIEWVSNRGYEYIALFNNDAVADSDWIKNLVYSLNKSPDIGVSTGLLLSENGNKVDTTGEFFSSWGLAFPRNRGDDVSKAAEGGYVFGASGGASLYKTALFKDIGLFDEDFFAYYEDADISFRAQLAGWKVAYTPKAIAYHKQGATSNRIPGFTAYQTFKNLPLLFLKDVPAGLLLPVGVRFYFAYVLILLNAISKGNGIPALKGAWMSFILGFKKLAERRNIQKNKRVPTTYIKNILWQDLPPDQTGLRKLRQFFTGIR